MKGFVDFMFALVKTPEEQKGPVKIVQLKERPMTMEERRAHYDATAENDFVPMIRQGN